MKYDAAADPPAAGQKVGQSPNGGGQSRELGAADTDPATADRGTPARMRNHWESNTEKWRNEQRHPYWYLTFDDVSVIRYVESCQRLLPPDGFDLVPADALHMTIAAAAESDMHRQVATPGKAVSPFQTILGPAVAISSAVCLSAGPADRFDALADSVGVKRFWPHVAIAYSNSDRQIDDNLEGALAAIRRIGGQATQISEVQLVNLRRSGHQYKWDAIRRFSLG